MTKDWMPHYTKTNRRERWQLMLLGLAGIYDGLIMLLSCGYLTTEIRGWLLFDIFDDWETTKGKTDD